TVVAGTGCRRDAVVETSAPPTRCASHHLAPSRTHPAVVPDRWPACRRPVSAHSAARRSASGERGRDMVTTLRALTYEGDLAALRAWLEEQRTLDLTDALARLDPQERAMPFRLLSKDRALAVFEALDPIHQQ